MVPSRWRFRHHLFSRHVQVRPQRCQRIDGPGLKGQSIALLRKVTHCVTFRQQIEIGLVEAAHVLQRGR
jgi:hypothetical protein